MRPAVVSQLCWGAAGAAFAVSYQQGVPLPTAYEGRGLRGRVFICTTRHKGSSSSVDRPAAGPCGLRQGRLQAIAGRPGPALGRKPAPQRARVFLGLLG